ncbi:MAG TPA: hypothetical protein VNY24_05490 [Candidatus Acidoferrales bacterium]|jgi:hypothetical protein|nr:hypothetical protein [Candidatus Acidoferrales bacterium]
MFIKSLENTRASQKRMGRHMLLPLFLTLIFAMSFWPTRAQAQIIGNLQAEIPFQFNVGNTTLPAGSYLIHHLEGNDLMVMEIRSNDGTLSALFNVESAEAKSAPEKTELIFNKYGDRYFLSELFDEGNADGNRLPPSRDEKKASKETGADVAHVAAHHPEQQGN